MLPVDSFSFDRIHILNKIQSKDEDDIFLIEDPDTQIKYVQRINTNKIIPEQDHHLFTHNMKKMTRITQYMGLLPIVYFTSLPNPTIIMEYKETGTLSDFINRNQNQEDYQPYFTDTKKYINLIGIAYTIQFLHGHNIFVHDINLKDIFLDENFYPHICIKPLMDDIIDYYITWPKDVYTFSIIAYELLTGKEITIEANENQENRPDLSIINSEWQKKFLQKCWSKHDTLRPNIFDILKDLESNANEFGNIDAEEVRQYKDNIQTCLSNYAKDVKKSASEKDRDWCFICGNMLINGYGVSINRIKAVRYYKMAADRGHVSSIFNYAIILNCISGFFSKKNEAARYFKLASDRGHSSSMFNYALMLYNGDGAEMNKEEAARYFKISSDLGNSNSMFNIAFMLEKGDGVDVNLEEAARYYKMSADHGNVTAMNSFASMLKKGVGVNRDKQMAAVYFKTAADFGDSSAMFNYAFMLKTGNGIQKDDNEAVKYFKLAAAKGNNSAAFNLALMFYNGEGIEMNKKKAAHYFKLAAESGNLDAMYNYALMLKKGDGIDMNKKKAIHYFKMAANKGHSGALNQFKKQS